MQGLSSAPVFDAAVIGRGPIGAAAALGLARAGLRVAVVAPSGPDASPVDPAVWDPRVFALSPASRMLLQRLRVWDALDAGRLAPVYDMRIRPDTGDSAPELHFSAYEAGVDALAWIIEGNNLSAALVRGLSFADTAGFDASVVAVDASAPESARLMLSDGRALRARLLVVADGAQSPMRAMLGLETTIRPYPQTAIVANFRIDRPHRDCAWQWFGPHGILALLPLPGQRCSIVWSAPTALVPEAMALSAEAFCDRIAALSGGAFGALHPLTDRQCFPLRLIELARRIAPRAVLLGDAAHVIHPLSGQGMNLGFGDVSALLDAVTARESFRDLGDPLLLRRYERARSEAVAVMRLTTDTLQRLFDPDAGSRLPAAMRPMLAVRDIGWRIVANSPWLRRRLIAHAAS